jgi:adenosylhomocysteine nucleosidase
MLKKFVQWIPALIFALLLLAAAGQMRQRIGSPTLDATPRYLILSAFDAEAAKLLSQMQVTQVIGINGRTYTAGKLSGKDVILVLSGESMVNAAMTAQTALDHFGIRGIIFSGIAGGVNPDLGIGDVVIPAQWGEYQEQLFARQSGEGWDTGYHARDLGNFGMMFPQKVGLVRKNGAPDQVEQRFWFQVSEELLAAAKEAVGNVKLADCSVIKVCLAKQPRVVVGGNGVSGSTFVDNAAYREWVWQTFHADALDMESAAVAHVAYTNATPFIAFRSLSDLAGGGPGQNELTTFFQLAADNSAAVVTAFLEKAGN